MMDHSPPVKVNGDTLVTCLPTGERDEDGVRLVAWAAPDVRASVRKLSIEKARLPTAGLPGSALARTGVILSWHIC